MSTGSPQELLARLDTASFTETMLPDGSAVLLDVDSHRVLTLSATASFLVGELRRGAATDEALAAALTAHYDVDEETALRDVRVFLAALDGALPPVRA